MSKLFGRSIYDTEPLFTQDQRGVISAGMRDPKTDQPKSLDHFNVSAFEEIQYHYGKKPQRLIITFLGTDLDEMTNFKFVEWAGKKKKGDSGVKLRECDGRYFRVMFDQKQPAGELLKVGELYHCTRGEDGTGCKCRASFWFLAFVVSPANGQMINTNPVKFRMGSDRGARKIQTTLLQFQKYLQGAFFELSLTMVKGDGGKKFPVWNMQLMAHRNTQVLAEQYDLSHMQLKSADDILLLGAGSRESLEQKGVSEMMIMIEEQNSVSDLDALGQELKKELTKYSEESVVKVREVYAAKLNRLRESDRNIASVLNPGVKPTEMQTEASGETVLNLDNDEDIPFKTVSSDLREIEAAYRSRIQDAATDIRINILQREIEKRQDLPEEMRERLLRWIQDKRRDR